MVVALIAAVTMVATDVLGVILVQAEAANRGWLAGLMDASQWGVGIATTTISVTALQGHDMQTKVLVVAFVTVANVLGTKLGQVTGKRVLGAPMMMRLFRTEGLTMEDRVAALERAVRAKGHL
jgi:hypothetical protein